MAPIVRAPGAPSDSAVALTRANAEQGAVGTSQRYIWNVPRQAPGASNDFPVVPTRHDGYDDIANIKSQFSDPRTVGGNWTVPFTGEDAAYVMRKRDDQENALFEQWVMNKYNIADPSQNLMLQSIAPELFKRREEVIDSQQQIVSRYAKLRLRGAKNLDDLRIQWLIETGRLTLPKGKIWDPRDWRDEQYENADGDEDLDAKRNAYRYKFGLFSPLKWVTTTGYKPSRDNPADIMGGTTRVTGAIPAPDPAWANVYGGTPIVYPYTAGNLDVAKERDDGGGYGAPVPNEIHRPDADSVNMQHYNAFQRARPWMTNVV